MKRLKTPPSASKAEGHKHSYWPRKSQEYYILAFSLSSSPAHIQHLAQAPARPLSHRLCLFGIKIRQLDILLRLFSAVLEPQESMVDLAKRSRGNVQASVDAG